MKKWILLVTVIFALLAINVETKKLVCAETGKADSAQVLANYQTIPGKKGAKGLKGEPGGITKQDLDKLESKKILHFIACCYNKVASFAGAAQCEPKI